MNPWTSTLIYTVLLFGSVIYLCFSGGSEHPKLDGLAEGVLATVALSTLEKIITKHVGTVLWLRCIFQYWDRPVRLSISYLIKIKIDQKYLLVRGSRIKDQFQPVGGVYKRYGSAIEIFRKLGTLDDNLFPVDETSKDDLRVRVRGRNVPRFIAWFNSELGREIGPWREFHEELVEPGILSATSFPHGQFEFLRRHTSKIHFSPYFQAQEILIADIFEFCPNDAQEQELRKLLPSSSLDILWVEEEDIRRNSTPTKEPNPKRISPTVEWLL